MWRAATPNDDPAIVGFYLALNTEDPGMVLPDPARMRRTLALLRRIPERGRCVVLDEGGNTLGYALLIPYWSNEIGGLVCCIDELYVAASGRGRGHGGELLELLAERALGWGEAVALLIGVSPANARARALYERHRFQPMKNASLVRTLAPPHAFS